MALDIPLPIERTHVQQGTELQYLNQMAERHAYTFYVDAGPLPGVNKAYWGPAVRVGVPQRALNSGMGSESNLINISFDYDGLRPQFMEGTVQDRNLNVQLPVQTFASTRIPIVSQPAWLTQPHARKKAFRDEAILKPRGVVGVRGVGFSYDGLYYVQQVSHTMERGTYRQRFSLEREGLGAISPVILP